MIKWNNALLPLLKKSNLNENKEIKYYWSKNGQRWEWSAAVYGEVRSKPGAKVVAQILA